MTREQKRLLAFFFIGVAIGFGVNQTIRNLKAWRQIQSWHRVADAVAPDHKLWVRSDLVPWRSRLITRIVFRDIRWFGPKDTDSILKPYRGKYVMVDTTILMKCPPGPLIDVDKEVVLIQYEHPKGIYNACMTLSEDVYLIVTPAP